MAVTIRDLVVALGIKADAKEVKAFDAALSAVKVTMFAVVGAVSSASTAIAGSVVLTALAGDETAKWAKRIGVGVEALQELEFAARASGAQIEETRDVLKEMRKRLAEARDGSEETAKAFAGLGVDIHKSTDVGVLLESLADGIAGVNDEAEQIRLADRIAGEAGVKLLPLLKAGGAGIRALRLEARALGGVMSAETAAASEEFADNLLALKSISTGLRNELAGALLPVINEMTDGFIDWFKANRSIIKQNLDRVFIRIEHAIFRAREAIVKVDKIVRERLMGWQNVFRQTAKVIGGALSIGAFVGFLKFLENAAVAAKLLRPILVSTFFVSAPLLLLVGTLAALGLAIDDLIVFSRGGESAIGKLLAAFGKDEETRDAFNAFLESGKEFAGAFSEALLDLANSLGLVELASALLGVELEGLRDLFDAIATEGIDQVNDRFAAMTKGLGILTNALKDPLDLLLQMLDALEGLVRTGDEFAAQALEGLGFGGSAERLRSESRAGRAGGGAAAGLAAARQQLAGGATARQAVSAGVGAATAVAGARIEVAAAQVNATVTGTVADLEAAMNRVNAQQLTQAMAAATGGNR